MPRAFVFLTSRGNLALRAPYLYMKRIIVILLSAISFQFSAFSAEPSAKEPIYIYLRAHVTDHVNVDLSEDQLRRLLPLVERYRKDHPDAHVSATVFFSGAVSQALAERNSQTHIVDFVKDYLGRGVIEAAYDGTDEPTYQNRPVIDFTQKTTPQDRWMLRRAADEKFLTEGRDPLTGAAEPGQPGGLKEMQAVFGEAACISGLTPLMKFGPGGMFGAAQTKAEPGLAPATVIPPSGMNFEVGDDTEAVTILEGQHSKAIMMGILDANIAHLPGFGGGRIGFGRLMSPIPETAPELFWQDNVLRISEASETVHLIHAYEGAEAIKKAIEKADRSRIHVVQVELASEQDYLKPEFAKGPNFPPLKYAYEHVQSPKLAADVLRVKSDVDAAYSNEEAVLQWLAGDFMAADPASHFVSSTDLMHMAAPSNGFTISMSGLQSALAEYLKSWGNDTFAPSLFRVEGHYLSTAEEFQVLADALAEFHRSGKLPESVKVLPVYGPIRVLTGHGPNEGEVSVATVARIAADIAPGLHDESPSAIPKNSIPIGVTVEGALLNPAQFLKLMAQAVVNPSPEARLNIRMAYEVTGPGTLLPKSRPNGDIGYVWTLKPVQIEFSNRATP